MGSDFGTSVISFLSIFAAARLLSGEGKAYDYAEGDLI